MKNRITSFLPSLPFSSPLLTSLFPLLLTFLTLFAVSVASAQIPSTGLVGYWPFNGNANDESGNGNNGIIYANLTSDRFGNPNSAYNFNQGSKIEVPMTQQLFELPVRSFSCWFRLSANQTGGRIYETTFQNGGIAFYAGSMFDTWYGYSQHCCNIVGLSAGPIGVWHHLVVNSNDNTGFTQVYLDGVEISTSNGYPAGNGCFSNTAWQWQGAFMRFGQGASGEAYFGDIDDIAIYNRALTPTEVAQLYTTTSSTLPPPCTAFLGEDQTVCAGTSVTLEAGQSSYSIGQTGPAGGIIFHTQQNPNGVTQVFEAAPSDIGNVMWGCAGFVMNQTSAAIGSGQQNTNAIISACGNSTAAALCANYTLNGADDWYLPSINELTLMFQNLWANGMGNFNALNGQYWSSTENSSAGSMIVSIAGALPPNYAVTEDNKSFPDYIRPCRSFTVANNTYLWSTGATTATINVTPTNTTTYTCTVTDANGNVCTDSITVFVPQIEATDLTICAGETTTLSVSGINSTATPSACPTLPTNLQTGLVGYWPFCGNANDASGNGNNGTVNGATLTTDRFGNASSAYSFDGVDDGVQVAISSIPVGSSPRSLSTWIYTSLSGNNFNYSHPHLSTVAAYGNPAGGPVIFPQFIKNLTGNLYVETGSSQNEIYSTQAINNAQWHNVITTYDGSFVKMYVDGVLNATSNSVSLASAFSNLGIGVCPWAPIHFEGKIDDVMLFNRALSDTEIQNYYQNYQNFVSHVWSNGATTPTINVSPTSTTTYTCTVMTNGVSCTDSVTVVVSNPVIDLGADVTVCGTSTTLTAPSGYDSYLWSNGGTTNTTTVSANGTYSCTVTQGGCSATDAVDVTLVNATVSASDSTICAGQSVTLSVPQGGSTSTACEALPTNLQTGLVGYWPFCGNANDASGNGNNGTVNGATLTTDRFGIVNSAYYFNGSSGSITINSNFYDNGWNENSIGLWFKPNSNNINGCLLNTIPHDGTAISFGNYGTNQKLYFAKNSDPNQHLWNIIGGNLGNHEFSYPIFNYNEWYFITITKNGNTYDFYINGVFDHSTVSTVSPISYYCAIILGNLSPNQGYASEFYKGDLDDFSVWNRALSAAEIQQIYNLGPTTYLWSTGATTPTINVSPTSTTTYTCTVTTNGVTCTDSLTVLVNNPTLNLGSDVTACGTSTTLTAPSGFDSYLWSNGGTTNTTTVSANGTYSCIGLLNGCSATDSVDVVLVSLDAQVNVSSICAGEAIELIATSNLSVNQNSNCIGNTGSPNPWPYPSAYNAGIIDLGNIGAQSVFSISTWVNAGATQNGISILLDASHGGSANWVVQAFGNNTYTWGSLSFTLTPNVWQHVLLTYVNGSKKCFIDGQLVASVYNPISYSGSPQLYLGNWPEGGRRFNGLVDELYITYSELQSSNFVPSQVINAPSANSFGLWHFDEGANGTTLNSVNGTVAQIGSWFWASRPIVGNATISWNGVAGSSTQTLSPVVTTTYVSSVLINGLTCSDSVTVAVNNPVIDLGADVTVCGTSTTLTAPSGYDSYLWSNGGATNTTTVSSNGTYSCTITQGGCSATDSIDVTLIDATITASDSIICAGEIVTLSVPQGGSSNTACAALPSNLQSGLVGYWPFCGNANDASGNGNTLNEYFVSYDTDRFGNPNASFFSNGIELGQGSSMTSSNPIFNIGQSEYTIGLWMKVQNTSQITRCLFNTIPHTGIGIAYNDNNAPGYVVYDIGPANAFWTDLYLHGSANNYQPNNWHYVVLKKQGLNYSQYIDGYLDHSYINPAAANYNYDVNFRISGISPENQIFHGNIDDVHIYNRALSEAEILQHFNLSATEITPPTYLWSNGATTPTIDVSPTSTTTYTCTVTTNGVSCTDSVTVVVSQPVASITPNGMVEICEGESIALTANGGTSYLWNTGAPTQSITVNTEAFYTVTVTDENGCTDTESQLVKVNFLPNIGVNNASICSGQSATLTATGGLSYEWSPAAGLSATTGATVTASPSTNTVYTVTGTGANGCTNTATAAVAVNALPAATITPATATTFCQGGGVVLNANTGAGLSYQWFNNTVAISGETSSTYIANTSGSYTVIVTSTTTCSSTSNSIDVTTVANVNYFADADGDGFGDAATLVSTCIQPQGYVTDNTDCDDNDSSVNTAATEVCNHIDDDCSGTIDDGLVFETYYADNDSDTYGDANNSIYECSQPSGYVTNNTDCNDNDANQNAASSEICNGEDDDCDGAIDNGLIFLDFYSDIDADGFGAGDVISSCTDLGSGYTTNNTDCDDSNSNTNPSATETCNTIDDNCDGQTDDGTLTVFFIDNDGDTYGNPSVSILACTQPIGYTPNDTDCNDTDANINPGAEDIGGNGIDENCDGQIDNSILELNSTIALYPNPTSSELNIQINSSIIGNDLYIFDAVGKLVFKQQLLSTQTTVPVSNFADGNYVVRVGEVVKRFVVEK
jgi:hypothetical protein